MSGARPRTIAELKALSGFVSEEGLARARAFRPGPSDIFISPYAKCGTTWMQQIVHGLRTGGAMDFAEITAAVPWLELAHDMGVDLDAPQAAMPRAFKSHLSWDEIPKGGRYIVVFRDPVDAMLSLYRFLDGWWFESGAIPLAEFAQYYLERPQQGYWGHAASWWRQRRRDDVLLCCFEDLKRDLPGMVARVADFIGVADPQAREIATRQASFEFMKRHAAQFDDHLVREARDAACGLPPGGRASKIDKGKSGGAVSDEIRAAFDARWQETMGRAFGLASYEALQKALSRCGAARDPRPQP